MQKIEHVFFDLGGVLYSLDYRSSLGSFARTAKKSVEEVRRVLYSKDIFLPYERGELSSREYYRVAVRNLDCRMSFEEFKESWNALLVKCQDMFEFAHGLKKEVGVLILSNTNELNAEAMKEDINRLTDKVVYSFRAGCMKPDGEIYRIALKMAGAEPEQTVFIDDNKENVEGARRQGINSRLFKGKSGLVTYLKRFGFGVVDHTWLCG
jgi:putative hydrolase of the HAD superfamily